MAYFWGPFGGPFWDQIGPRREQDEPKRAIKSFKESKRYIFENLEQQYVFSGFWIPEASQASLKRSKKAPKRHPKSSKAFKQSDPKMDPKITNFWTNFGSILGAILRPEIAQKGVQKWDQFWKQFWSNFGPVLGLSWGTSACNPPTALRARAWEG